jgi:hypothetical protein
MTWFRVTLPTTCLWVWVLCYADGQSASLSWNKAPIWGLWPDFYYCLTVAGLLMWGALPDERTGLLFTITAGTRQRSHSQVRVPRDSWPYFTVDRASYLNDRFYSASVSMGTLDDSTASSCFRRIYIFHFRIPGNVFVNPFPRNGSTCHNMLTKFARNSVNRTRFHIARDVSHLGFKFRNIV